MALASGQPISIFDKRTPNLSFALCGIVVVFENYPNRQLTFNNGTAAVVGWPSQLLSNFDKWTKFDSKQITKSAEISTIQFSTET